MKDVAALLEAIAAILWPAFAFVVLFTFKRQIGEFIGRLKKGKVLGQEIELSESLARLDKSAVEIATEAASLPAASLSLPSADIQANNTIKTVLEEAARSPKTSLMLLASEIEREARELLASVGRLGSRRYIALAQALTEIGNQFGGLPGHILSTVKLFSEVRNRLIHGQSSNPEDILRAIDSGITILKALQAYPREINVIYHPGVDVYHDPLCKKLILDVKGVILETESPGGTKKSFRIFPTTKTHFKKGKRVAWEWSNQMSWGEAWYRDPDTQEIKGAWSSAMEFVGRHLDEI